MTQRPNQTLKPALGVHGQQRDLHPRPHAYTYSGGVRLRECCPCSPRAGTYKPGPPPMRHGNRFCFTSETNIQILQ